MPLPADAGSRLPAETSNTGKNEHTRARIFPRTWAAATAYAVGEYVRPTSANGHIYYAQSISGTGTSSASTEPTWPTTSGATVTDNAGANQIVWVEAGSDQVHESYVIPSSQSGNALAIASDGSIAVTDNAGSLTVDGSVGLNAGTNAVGSLSDTTAINQSLVMTSTANAVTLSTFSGASMARIVVGGTFTGNWGTELSMDGTTWQAQNMLREGDGVEFGNYPIGGILVVPIAGYKYMRVRCVTAGTGTATVSVTATSGAQTVSVYSPLPQGSNYIGRTRVTDGTNDTTLINANASGSAAYAQPVAYPTATIAGTITSAAGAVTLALAGHGTGMATVTGTWGGNVVFQVSNDGGTTWTSTNGVDAASGQGGSQAFGNITGWRFAIGGATHFRCSGAGWTSGTVNVALSATGPAAAVQVTTNIKVRQTDGSADLSFLASAPAGTETAVPSRQVGALPAGTNYMGRTRLTDGTNDATLTSSIPTGTEFGVPVVDVNRAATYSFTYNALSSGTLTASTDKALVAIWHPNTVTKRAEIKRVVLALEALTTGATVRAYLRGITSAPTGGTAATVSPLDAADAATGLTIQSAPTGGAALSGGTVGAYAATLGAIAGTSATTTNMWSPSAGLLYQSMPGAKDPTMRASQAEGWAIVINSTGTAAVTFTVSVVYSEE